MNRATHILSLVALTLTCTISSCRKDLPEPEPEVENPTIVIAPNAIWINDATSSTLQSVDSVVIVFSGNTEQLLQMAVGKTIVSGIAENAPYGFMRRITAIDQAGSLYTLTTEEVPMTEAFQELNIDYSKTFTVDDTARSGPVFTINLPDVVVFDNDGNNGTTHDQVRVNGSVDVTPVFNLAIRISGSTLQAAKLEGKFQADLTNTVIAGGAVGSFGGEVTIYEQPLAPIAIPSTPIVVVPVLVVSVGAQGSIQVSVEAGYTNSLEVGAHVEYAGGAWQTGFSRSMTATHSISAINGSIEAKAYVAPSLDLRFWGSKWAKGYVRAEAYVSANASLIPTPGCQVRAGVNAGLGAQLGIFGWNFIEVEFPSIFDYNTLLYTCTASAGGPVADFSAQPVSVVAGGTVNFTDQSTGTPSVWQWEFVGGTPSSSTAQSPSVVYNTPGTYDVVLTVSNANGSNSLTRPTYITVSNGSPPCGGQSTVTDIDGNVYNVVAIGDQCWMAENLKTSQYQDGSSIPNETEDNTWVELASGAWAHYNNNSQYDAIYGKLYNWYAVSDPRNVCPTGWHVPTDAEWQQLEAALGMPSTELAQTAFRGGAQNVGGKLKSAGTQYWYTPNYGATNESGFSGLPGGFRNTNGANGGYLVMEFQSLWWSSTESDLDWAWFRKIHYNFNSVYRLTEFKSNGFNVRCVKD